MSYSMWSRVEIQKENAAYLYINGKQQLGTEHTTYSASGVVYSTGGRVVTLEASAGDKIEIKATIMEGIYRRILYCAEYIPKM